MRMKGSTNNANVSANNAMDAIDAADANRQTAADSVADHEYRTLISEYRIRRTNLLMRAGIFIGTVLILFTMVFGIAKVDSNDMYPAIREGDIVLFYRHPVVRTSDVVLYKAGGSGYAGRIEGVTGAEIGRTEDYRVTIDGRFQPVQPERGIYSETRISRRDAAAYPLHLKEGEYYILADRRDESDDSRTLGIVRKNQIKGKVVTVWRMRGI